MPSRAKFNVLSLLKLFMFLYLQQSRFLHRSNHKADKPNYKYLSSRTKYMFDYKERQQDAGKRRASGVKGTSKQAYLNASAFIASRMLAFRASVK